MQDACDSLPDPSVTACLCGHNRPAYVRDCLAGTARQTVRQARFRILVEHSGSTQHAHRERADIVATHANADMIAPHQPGVRLARNAGATACGTDCIANIDDDTVPAPDWIEQMIAAVRTAARPSAAIGGRILPQ
jgi:GT2 family glycosyltransferase